MSRFEEYRTFNEWSARGYYIIKGEKCRGFKKGEPVFGPDQVEEYEESDFYDWLGLYDWDFYKD